MSSLSPEQLKTLSPSTDLLITKIPAIVETSSNQYSGKDYIGAKSAVTIPRAPKSVVAQVRRGEIIFTKKMSAVQSSSITRHGRTAREPIGVSSSLNGYGDGTMSVGDIRDKVVILGVAEVDASYRDGENFPVIAKGMMSVPTIAMAPIRKGSLVIAYNPTPAEVDTMIKNGKAHPDMVAGKHTFIYKSIGRSELLPNVGHLSNLTQATAYSSGEKAVVNLRNRLVAATTAADKDKFGVMLGHAIATLAVDEERFVIGEAMTSSREGPLNSFDLKISVG